VRHAGAAAGSGAAAEALLKVEDLGVRFRTGEGDVRATEGVSFSIQPGERVGIVGESGCGKTVTGLSLMGLLPARIARVEGHAWFEGSDLVTMSRAERRAISGARIGMIFQEPMSALDPVFTVGEQISETLRAHRRIGRREARERAIEALDRVGIPLPARRYGEYPHSLSGGMRQRVMIAMALACEPKLLIADEPTTALDVTIQAQIIDLLLSISEQTATALLFITHDLGVVAEICTRVITMYAGQVVEDAPIDAAFVRPRHPYTSGLLRSLPHLGERGKPLPSIPGRVPRLGAMPDGCRFGARCVHADDRCAAPPAFERTGAGYARCHRLHELTLPGANPVVARP